MLEISIAVNDASRSVTVSAQSDSEWIDFYRRVGMSDDMLLASSIPVLDGVATFVDTSPPEKTLLTYAAVNVEGERSENASGVVPSTWSLARPTLAGDIRLGDMVFNTIDSDGTVWTVSDIEGWWSLPEADIPTEPRAREEDGSYSEDGRYLARTLTFSGVFLPIAPDALEVSRMKLINSLNAVRRTISLRVDQNPPRQMSVRLSGKSAINTVRQSGLTEFAFELIAADPVKYAVDPMERTDGSTEDVTITSGSASIGRGYPRNYDTSTDNLREYGTTGAPNSVQTRNEGNYSTPPVLRIDGPVTNPRIELVETGQLMEFLTSLQLGEYLLIDVKEKTVLLNGATSRRGTMTFGSDWFMLPPGVSTLKMSALSAPTYAGQLTVTAYSAWLG